MDSYEAYSAMIKKVSRQPMRPVAGFSLFFFLLAISFYSKRVLGVEYAGLVFILLLLVFPYYVVQLTMKWRMEQHLLHVQRLDTKPSYVPSNPNRWASIYIAVFFITGYLFFAIDKLLKT